MFKTSAANHVELSLGCKEQINAQIYLLTSDMKACIYAFVLHISIIVELHSFTRLCYSPTIRKVLTWEDKKWPLTINIQYIAPSKKTRK